MNRKTKSLLAVALISVLTVLGLFVHRVAFAKEEPAYRFATVQRGDLQSTVSSTGTLSAVTTVSVGTQVSGQVSELLVDFNDQVKKGQLLARIDPTLAQQAVTDAQANVEKAQAQLLQASRDFNRNRELGASGLVAKSAIEQTESTEDVAAATVKSARVALERARQNLSYTSIYAPIDGVVVERNVSQGQTVAASLSAPQLFLIANDLTHMQILAQVGESDIASIKEGQPVNFTVQALPNQKFEGVVQQVRLQSTTSENVVNYTVVVTVDNPQHKLLPGMTARVEFLTSSAKNALTVPNSALRFRPAEGEVAKKTTTATATTTNTASAANGQRRQRTGNGASNFGSVYTLDAEGKLQRVRVRTGLTDGTQTVVEGKDLVEGMKIVIGSATPASAQTAQKTSTSSSPFQNGQQQQRGGGGPRGGF
ncbi:MAG: efflux RND transporter periplasmic adaptor subunit [Acidobacteria bacterium]|nr:efflux RND transporter periplasmic adaptor subunit [Acidobacteriota bacterium]